MPMLINSIVLVLLMFFGAVRAETLQAPPADTTSQADLTDGPFEIIEVEEIRFQRDEREMPLPLLVRYPQATEDQPGPFPLVIVSHGMGGYTDAFEHLSKHLASHGYVVIHPAHTDSIKLRREAGESAQSLRNTFTRSGTSVVDLPSRVQDCLWIVENLDAIETKIERTGLIDRDKRAMAGHSAGAFTTQALAGVKFQTPRGRLSRTLSDGSVFDAYVVISGQGTTSRTLSETSWSDISKPMLVFSGTEDGGGRVSSETPESRRHPYEYSPAGHKYLIYIEGATHSSYQGGDAPNADEDRIEALASHATLAFLDLYVRGQDAPTAWLTNPDSSKFAGVTAEYLSK